MTAEMRRAWARTLTSEPDFLKEQASLGKCWTLLAIGEDLLNDGDWIRATLGGKSVFVQRFGDQLKGFENRCAHRFFPLRTADKGNGPIVCGFHHWRYDRDGLALGIPHSTEVYGKTPREIGARLPSIDIATCGSLVFGRFPSDDGESLEAFLGDGFPILATIADMPAKSYKISDDIAANWMLLMQITLDDYHLVAVHHRKKFSMNREMAYYRFGAYDRHSTQFVHTQDTPAIMAAQCLAGNCKPDDYRIFNIFPNVAVSLFRAKPYWYCFIQQFIPVSAGRSQQRGWFYRTKIEVEETAFEKFIEPVSEIIRPRIVRYFTERTGDEDHRACEQLQSVAAQADAWPILSSQEKRIEWFWQAYQRSLTTAPAPEVM